MSLAIKVTLLGLIALFGMLPLIAAPQLQLLLPLERTVYQTNETIDLAVVRSDAAAALPAGDLLVTLVGKSDSKMTFSFALPATNATSTEQLHLNGRLLRPDSYTVEVTYAGASAQATITVYSHLRKSSFRIIDWSSRANAQQYQTMGEDSLGFNLIYGGFRNGQTTNVEGTIRGAMDYTQVCTMSGAHQMDLRMECDWSDPYVMGGGVARATRQAFVSRITPNAVGVHFYDEPGLTWENGSCFKVTAQLDSYKRAFGIDAPNPDTLDPNDPAQRSAWKAWQNWHYGFMDAYWKHAKFGVEYVKADYLSLTQSVYGFTAYADGYYFNVVRSLPVISGHGGYSDGFGLYMYPGFHMEYGRMRDLNKPYWYLPSWYRMSSDQYRLEDFLSFQNNLQGMAKPPDYQVHTPAACQEAQGIVETNKLQLRLGTIFSTMPVTRPPVAVLYSMSMILDSEMKDLAAKKPMNIVAYDGGGHVRIASIMAYMSSKALHIPFFPVVEEDIKDGTLARNHKVLVVPYVNALEPNVIAALQGFIKGGGTVLIDDASAVDIPGAKRVGASINIEHLRTANAAWGSDNYWIMSAFDSCLKANEPYTKALGARLKEAGITPIIDCDSSMLVASRQALGDIEYLFAVNATHDLGNKDSGAIMPIEATIGLPDDGRPVYDAVYGGTSAFKKVGGALKATYRFGPGQMRVFARTTRPIGGVQAMPVDIFGDMTVAQSPIHATVTATLVDTGNRMLSGSAPMEVIVLDPLGVSQSYFRATDRGILKFELPLAANDPAGYWSVTVRELLTGKEDKTTFNYQPVTTCGAVIGTTVRAIAFDNDRENIFRFFKLHRNVTIVTGSSAYNQKAAERLTQVLAPWGVQCTTVAATEVNKPYTVPKDAVRTWVGLVDGRPDFTNPNPSQLGFAISGPAILLGTPEDNPLIKFGQDQGFLPYKAKAGQFPGNGRGYLAWQTDMIGYFNQESITLVAYDQLGMDEAVGSVYEIAAGMEPLMAFNPPAQSEIAAASKQEVKIATPEVVWRTLLPDRILGITVNAQGVIEVVTNDGSLTTLNARGVVTGTKVLPLAEAKKLLKANEPIAEVASKVVAPTLIVKTSIAVGNELTALGYWGGALKIVNANGEVKKQQMLTQDITSFALLNGQLLVGLADGQLYCLEVKAP